MADSSDRRSLRERAASLGSSVAGTLSEKAQDVKETAQRKVERRKARRELEDFRSDEVTDQGQARLERARREAQAEARKEAREEAQEEVKEATKERVKEEELQEIRREYGIGEDDGSARADDLIANTLFGTGGVTNDDPAVMVGVDENNDGQFQPGEVSFVNPGAAPMAEDDDSSRSQEERGGYDVERRLGELFGPGPESPQVGPMMDESDDEDDREPPGLPFF